VANLSQKYVSVSYLFNKFTRQFICRNPLKAHHFPGVRTVSGVTGAGRPRVTKNADIWRSVGPTQPAPVIAELPGAAKQFSIRREAAFPQT
jgi:hypothetical protein